MDGYSGNIAQIPLGSMGVLTDQAPSQIPYNALIRAFDIDYGPGYIQKAPGSLRYNSGAVLPAGIVALIDYWPDIVTQRMLVATSAGKIYRDNGDRTFTAQTAIKSGLGALDTNCGFVIGGAEIAGRPKKVFFFSNGNAQPQVLSGDTAVFGEIDEPANDWAAPNYPRFGLIHRNRLWAFMGNRFYASETGDHENFTDSSTLSGTVGPGDGGDCITGIIYKGKMIIFKEGDIVYFLDDTDASSSNWVFKRLGEGFGIASTHAAMQALDDLLVGNNTGSVTSYQAVQAYGDIRSGDIFRQAQVNQYFREVTSLSGAAYMHALFYTEKHLALFTGRTKAGTKNDCIIALDVQNPSTPRYSLWKKDNADCLALRRDIYNVKRPMYGASDGYVYLMDREDRLVGGSAYTGEFMTPHLDFHWLDASLSHKNKVFDWLWVTFQEEGQHNLSVDVYIDGRFSETLTFPQTIGTNYMDAAIMDTSKMSIQDDKVIGRPLHGTGRRISFRCYNSGSNENFKVSQLTVGFNVAAEDATRLTAT